MAPLRRYLRITPYSVLEVRIYLDNPALTSSWLLSPRAPVLPRVIEAVRPLVLPKLKEENARERNRGKGKGGSSGKKKGVKDVVVEDDFEVSIFLTETSTRHSLLTKQKHFREHGKNGLRSNSDKLTGAGTTSEEAILVEDVDGGGGVPLIRREDSDEDMVDLKDIPVAAEDDDDGELFERMRGRPKRGRRQSNDEDEEDGLFVDEDDSDDEPQPKRMKDSETMDHQEDKKKMAMDTSYDGFSIYGRVLCLVVKKRDTGKAKGGVSGGRAMMEEWITSTQMPPIDDDGL